VTISIRLSGLLYRPSGAPICRFRALDRAVSTGTLLMNDSRGILLVNLGSPDAPTPSAVRRYLKEFLGDPLVVDAPRILWWLLLRLIILPFRGRSSARLYAKVWTEEGAPLIAISRHQRDALAERLGSGHVVEMAMRYGSPSIESGLRALADAGVRDVRLLSMYPQSSQASTVTVDRKALEVAESMPDAPPLEIVPPYFDHPAYIEALRSSVVDALGGTPADHYVFSFHGCPVRYIEENGDPYQSHCEATAKLLAEALELAPDAWTLAYQSRFGREPWLEPDTAVVVPELATKYERMAVVTPGFPTDCLETLEEIAIQLVEGYEEAGGKDLVVVPGLNTRPDWIDAMARIVAGE
jgi:ferrochelatase